MSVETLNTQVISIALEAIECSNRCKHCEASHVPRRRHLSRDEIRSWADRMKKEAEDLGVQVEIGWNNSELFDHPQWREIRVDFGCERFNRGLPTNGRQIAREPELIHELKERGVEWLQLTLGGGTPETHDAFTCRPGSFEDILNTARIAHSAGVHVDWNYIAYRPLSEVARMSEVARSISGPYAMGKFDHKGGIDQGIMLVKPQGEGVKMEHLRPTRADLAELPEWATKERFGTWSGVGCETEGEMVAALVNSNRCIGCIECEYGECSGAGLIVSRNGDVYPYCHERDPAYLLGNVNDEGLGRVLERWFNDPPLAVAIRRRGLAESAAVYGDADGDKLHNGCSFCRTLVVRALEKEIVEL